MTDTKIPLHLSFISLFLCRRLILSLYVSDCLFPEPNLQPTYLTIHSSVQLPFLPSFITTPIKGKVHTKTQNILSSFTQPVAPNRHDF